MQEVEQIFDHILLEPEQKELLVAIVEAARNTPRSGRQKFILIETMQGSWLDHSGFAREKLPVYKGDIETLGQAGIISISFSSRGTLNFDITPLGFKYYEYF